MSDTGADTDDGTGELFETDGEDADIDTQTRTVELEMSGEIDCYDRIRHRSNGDETLVILSAFTGGYQAYAVDVSHSGELLAIEEIGDAPDEGRAVGMCDYWLQNNPNGVLGGEDEQGGLFGGFDGLFGGGDS